jgi:hypothetical protein
MPKFSFAGVNKEILDGRTGHAMRLGRDYHHGVGRLQLRGILTPSAAVGGGQER